MQKEQAGWASNGRIAGVIIPVVGGFIALIVFFILNTAFVPKPGVIPQNKEIEDRFGIQFESISLTADNGLVDVRYKVLDVGKAKNFGHYTETSPLIIAEDSGNMVEVAVMGFHNHRVEPGRTYYLLYRNTGNYVRPGSKVTIKIDTVNIEHVVVR